MEPGPADSPPAVIVPDNLTALGLVRSLAAHGVPCTVCAWNALGPARYSRHARAVACPPPHAGRQFIDALLAIGRSFAAPPVLFVTDESSAIQWLKQQLVRLLVARAHEELARHFTLTIPSPTDLAAVLSKPSLYELSAAAGVSAPESWTLQGDRVPPGVPYPIVVKPQQRVIWTGAYTLRSFRDDFGCKALLARDAREARAIATRARALGYELLLQRLVPGEVTDLRTAGVFAGRNGTRALFTARKLAQVPHDFGDGSIVEGVPMPELEPLVWRLIERAGFRGLADIEFKLDTVDGRLKLLDFNPRPWLWIELATRCGVNLAHLRYCDAIGRQVTAVPVQTADAVTWCSGRRLARTLWEQGWGRRAAALRAALRAWRGAHMAGTFARTDPLWRMWLHPRFWHDVVRTGIKRSRAGFRPREVA